METTSIITQKLFPVEELPELFKQNKNGSIQTWKVKVMKTEKDHGVILRFFGQVGGKIQDGVDVISQGKNVGKKNGTTPITQAQAEAKQEWDAKVKKGYSPDVKKAEAGDKGLPGIDPMLAHKFKLDKTKTKVVEGKHMPFPCLTQPKMDGLRAICMVEDGKATWFSRTRKQMNTIPHLTAAIEQMCKLNGIDEAIFDGELYSHEFKHDFNAITSRIKRGEIHPDAEKIEYWMYDLPSSKNVSFVDRAAMLRSYLKGLDLKGLVIVPTIEVKNVKDLVSQFEDYVGNGFEGLMLRDPDSYYEADRSKNLLKFKQFDDAEFKIVGVQEGKGKLMGHAGSFICVDENGRQFKAKLKGELSGLKEKFDNFEKKYLGKTVTVQYFGLTPLKEDGTGGVPRFPVALRIREEE